jgi:hypothetical protein
VPYPNRSPSVPILLLAVTLCSMMFLFACGAAASQAPIAHPDIVECGGPMAEAAAERAATVAYDLVAKGASVEDIERAVLEEIKGLAVKHGGGFAQCLIDRALNAHRLPTAAAMPPQSPQPAALQARYWLIAPSRAAEPLAGLGFVPLTRDLNHARPWHTLLAGARGNRS